MKKKKIIYFEDIGKIPIIIGPEEPFIIKTKTKKPIKEVTIYGSLIETKKESVKK